VSKAVLTDIATQYQRWVVAQAKAWRTPIMEAPAGRRDTFVEPYFRRAKPDQVVVIVKGREPARILTAIGTNDRWHLQYARRWIVQYNFYLIIVTNYDESDLREAAAGAGACGYVLKKNLLELPSLLERLTS